MINVSQDAQVPDVGWVSLQGDDLLQAGVSHREHRQQAHLHLLMMVATAPKHGRTNGHRLDLSDKSLKHGVTRMRAGSGGAANSAANHHKLLRGGRGGRAHFRSKAATRRPGSLNQAKRTNRAVKSSHLTNMWGTPDSRCFPGS